MKKLILLLICASSLHCDTFLDDYERLVKTGDGRGINLEGLELGPLLTSINNKLEEEHKRKKEKHKRPINLSYANLQNTNLDHVVLKEARFEFANLTNASLKQAILAHLFADFCSLKNAKLDGATIQSSFFRFADLCGATLDQAIIDPDKNKERPTNFCDAVLYRRILKNSWSGKEVEEVAIKKTLYPLMCEKGTWTYDAPNIWEKLDRYLARKEAREKGYFENKRKEEKKKQNSSATHSTAADTN